jgi:ribosomal protein S18 acetylase RimI-like enzyme
MARAEDLERTYEIFVTATNELNARRNLPLIQYNSKAPPRSLAFRKHVLVHDAQRYWVAEDQGTLIGFGIATLREGLWYLAALHVWPGYQNQGVGRRLLELCMSPENAPAVQTYIVISDSINPDSNALYAKRGMYQYVPLLSIDGLVPAQLAVNPQLRMTPFTLNDAPRAVLAELDRHVLGVERWTDHTMWLTQPDLTGYFFAEGEHVVGYAYVSTQGGVGPLAVYDAPFMQPVLSLCLQQLQANGTHEAAFKIPSSNQAGVGYLLKLGFRLHSILLCDASQPFGHLEHYLVSVGEALF